MQTMTERAGVEFLERAPGAKRRGRLPAACADDGGVRRRRAGRWRSSNTAGKAAAAASMSWSALLADRHAPARVRAFAAELRKLEMLQPSGSLRPINPTSVKVNSYPLSTLVLNVNTGCNLSCTYCYKEDLAKPKDGRKMDFVTAARSVDLLLAAGAARERVNIVFFGGEPLSNVPLIKQVVGYAEAAAERAGKHMDFSLTTNATLLTPALDRLLRCAPLRHLGVHRWPQGHPRPASQDRRRPGHLRGGRAQGGRAARALSFAAGGRARHAGGRHHRGRGDSRALARRDRLSRGRLCAGHGRPPRPPTPCPRTELQRGARAPSSAWARIIGARRWPGRNNGFSNMHQLMTDLHEGRRKSLPCGAGSRAAGGGRRGRTQSVPSLHGLGSAHLRQRGRRHRRRAPGRFHRQGHRP